MQNIIYFMHLQIHVSIVHFTKDFYVVIIKVFVVSNKLSCRQYFL